jgi:hypothetical protein
MDTSKTASAHTPGPWTPELDYSGTHWFVEHQMGGERYTLVDDISDEADARLIAAAPELLEACRFALDQIMRQQPEWAKTHDVLIAAIGKAA